MRSSWTGASGLSILGSSKARPSAAGVQLRMSMPFGTYTNTIRFGESFSVADAARERAGAMESRTGRAIAAPTPRSRARLDTCFRVRINSYRFLKLVLVVALLSGGMGLHHPGPSGREHC